MTEAPNFRTSVIALDRPGDSSVFDEKTRTEAREIIARYPDGNPRSALGPMLHLVQSVQGHITPDGMGNSLEHVQKIMATSMESLIHHFKLVTEGFRVPPGQVYSKVESPRGELGAHVVSDGGTRPYRVHFREPSFINLQSTAILSVGGLIADVIASVASIDPVMGGVDR